MVLFEDFEPLDVVGPHSLFRSVPGLHVETVARRRGAVAGSGGISLDATASFDESRDPDVLFVPGGAGIVAALADRELLAYLADRGGRAKYVTSVCTGSLILGAAGLLRGYRATTHWRSLDLLAPLGAEPRGERVVRDRNRITGGGVTAGLDFGLVLVAELCGEAAAQRAQLELEYDPHPPYAAGTPDAAPLEIVDAVVAATASRQKHRAELLEPFRASS